MIAALRKDLELLLVLFVVGFVPLAIVLGQESFFDIWVLPPRRLEGPFHCAWICGAVLGLALAVHDELLGTREYLRHRPTSPARLHAARLCGAALVLAAWLLLVPLVPWLCEALFGHLAALGRPAHAVEVAATMLPAASACAIGLFAGTLPAGPVLRLCAGAAALLATFQGIEAVATPSLRSDGWICSLPWFAALHGLAALLFAAASFAGARAAHDPDRPWHPANRWIGGSLGTLTFAAFATALLAAWQQATCGSLLRDYPVVVRNGDEYRLAVRVLAGRQFSYLPVDAQHARAGAPLDRRSWNEVAGPYTGLGKAEPGFDAPRFHWISNWPTGRFFQFEDGRVMVIHEQHAGVHWTGKGAEGEPFAPGTRLIEGGERPETVLALEPGSGLWRYEPDAGWFAPLPLPAGDRLRDARQVRRPVDKEQQRLTVAELVYQVDPEETLAVIGDRAVYQLRDAELQPAPEWMLQQLQQPQPLQRRFVDDDPLTPHLRLLNGNSALLFEHRYEPRTAAERLHAGLVLYVSCLRPPLLQLASHLLAPQQPPRHPFTDPLLAGGRRPILLLLDLAVAGLCAFAAWRWLARRAAPVGVRRFWLGAALLLGPAALIACLCVERRRAWAPSPTAAIPAAPPRIRSPQPA